MVMNIIKLIGCLFIFVFCVSGLVYAVYMNIFKPEEVAELKKQQENIKQAKLNRNLNSEGKVVCPNCGSTQIQLVNKKWSLMTGFFTNKVDRVCVACKKKF